ncbi:hypothetical protein B0H13DRAFT_2324860 [Mycena leptocephala]|nr:hypothetical protein B0H13DRAFT_2324860 [Mycena leptocephala]
MSLGHIHRPHIPARTKRTKPGPNRRLLGDIWFTLGVTVLLAIKVFAATSIDQFEEEWDWLILGLFGATGGVDLLIAASMCYYTMKNRAILSPSASGKIDTIISWTAQTGLFTCMAAIAVTVCFATMKQDRKSFRYIWLPLLILTTGLYSNSLLSLLNGRLHLGYQTADPFMITLSTFRQSSRNRSAQPQFSVSRRTQKLSANSTSKASVTADVEFQALKFGGVFDARWVRRDGASSGATLYLGSRECTYTSRRTIAWIAPCIL